MDNDVFTLLQYLSKKKYSSLKDIETSLGITRRQSIYRLEKLNALLKKEKVPEIELDSTSSKGFTIDSKTSNKITTLLSNNIKEQYYMNKKERLIYMYLMMFLNLEYLSLNDFIDSLRVSRSTVLLDFKELVQNLDENGIKVKNNRKNGYYLDGDEVLIRRKMMDDVTSIVAEGNRNKIFDIFIDDYKLDLFNYSRLVIIELSKKHNIYFVEDRLIEFIYIFIFLKARMNNGKNTSNQIEQFIDNNVMKSMKEYEFTLALLQNYKNTENITEEDIHYISSWILGISFGDVHEDTKDCILISEIVGKIMKRFESLSGAHYKNKEEIFIQLYSHFRPAYYRLMFKLPIYNPLCKKVQEKYKDLYQLVEETMKPLSVIFGGEIPEGEIAYLTMHFATMYPTKRKESDGNVQKKALIVCSNGIGSSTILYNELKTLFPELHFLPPMDTNNFLKFEGKVDIIFTTSTTSITIETDIPIIQVRPIMTIEERYQVTREVYLHLDSSPLEKPNVNIVMDIVSKYSDIHSKNELYIELLNYFSKNNHVQTNHKILSMIQMIQPSIIQFDIEVNDWMEAIRKAYMPMLNNGYITQNYVEDTIQTVEQLGPFVVITKNVALLHTKPEAGALVPSLGIAVLKNPIEFGNKDNDPVKYIFTLSVIDNQSHISAMAEFVELLSDSSFFQLLNHTKNSNEVINYIKNL